MRLSAHCWQTETGGFDPTPDFAQTCRQTLLLNGSVLPSSCRARPRHRCGHGPGGPLLRSPYGPPLPLTGTYSPEMIPRRDVALRFPPLRRRQMCSMFQDPSFSEVEQRWSRITRRGFLPINQGPGYRDFFNCGVRPCAPAITGDRPSLLPLHFFVSALPLSP